MLETIEKLSAISDFKLEIINGKIVPKEGSDPIPQEIIDYMLGGAFDPHIFSTLYDMPKTSYKHREIIAALNEIFAEHLNRSQYRVYLNDMTISSKLFGGFYIPDITFALKNGSVYDQNQNLQNPHSIIEVLSPATEKKDRGQKKEDYQNMESLQEYVLISQDCHKIEQFLRKGKTDWTVKVYTEDKESCILTVGVKINLGELYKNIKNQ